MEELDLTSQKQHVADAEDACQSVGKSGEEDMAAGSHTRGVVWDRDLGVHVQDIGFGFDTDMIVKTEYW